MGRRLIIEKFGKIKKAELEISPLTLLVGDNNSGKSYLLSLLWGIYTADGESVLFQGIITCFELKIPATNWSLFCLKRWFKISTTIWEVICVSFSEFCLRDKIKSRNFSYTWE